MSIIPSKGINFSLSMLFQKLASFSFESITLFSLSTSLCCSLTPTSVSEIDNEYNFLNRISIPMVVFSTVWCLALSNHG